MKAYVNTANKKTVNLREQPSKTSKILAQIPYKTELEVERYDNTWSKTIYGNYEGYVMTEFLSCGSAVTKSDLQEVYNKLKATLDTIESILK